MPGFKIIEHVSEAGVEATGRDLRKAFANAALGMFSIIVELETVEPKENVQVEVEAPNREDILVSWLNELIYRFEAQSWVFCKFEVMELTDTHLKAKCWGEKADEHKHRFKTGVKSATYHALKVQKGRPAKVQVVLDL